MLERMAAAMAMHFALHWDGSFAPAVLAAVLTEAGVEVESPSRESDEAGDPLPIVRAGAPPIGVVEVAEGIDEPVGDAGEHARDSIAAVGWVGHLFAAWGPAGRSGTPHHARAQPVEQKGSTSIAAR